MILAREPAARIASVASSFPSNTVGAADAVRTLRTLFPEQDAELVKNLVERSGVETRRIVPTLEEVLGPSTFTARNDRYQVAATELGIRASRLALERASITPREIDVSYAVEAGGATKLHLATFRFNEGQLGEPTQPGVVPQ